VAAATGSVNLGARIGYQMAREYDLLDEGDVMYRPGNQLYVRFGADRSFGAARAAAQVTLYHFGKDVMNSQNLYQSGNRIHALLTFVTPFGRMGRAQVYASALQRQRGEFLDGAPSTPSQTVVTVGGGLRQPIGGVVFVPSVDVRLLRRSDGLDQGFMSSAGASLELPAGDVVTLLPSARVRYGTLLVSEGVETNITGFEVATALRFGRRQ
jgi:hypothetical protein